MEISGYETTDAVAKFALTIMICWGLFEAGRVFQRLQEKRARVKLAEAVAFFHHRCDELTCENIQLKRAAREAHRN